MMDEKKYSIAIVGSGVAGLTAAYLLNKKHDVTVFEKNDYPGGHTHTIIIKDGPDEGVPVDTGFIVMNHRNYPLFTKLLKELNAGLRDSNMSFGYYCENTGFQYSSRGINGLFARRSNIFNPVFLKMIKDILKFYKISRKDLETDGIGSRTLGGYLRDNDFSETFINHHIIPMGAAIWSTPDEGMMDFPAESFLLFLNNHGLLSVGGQPQWRTVTGGSFEYVKIIRKSLKSDVYINTPVVQIERKPTGVTVKSGDGKTRNFDFVVIAAHADEALALLKDPSADEKRLLSPWYYQNNHTILHTDPSLMPPLENAKGSWNFIREKTAGNKSVLSLTYDMNRLQGLKTENNYFVTLNTGKSLKKGSVIAEMDYHHPTYSFSSMKTQKELPLLNGINKTYFCGSYFGYGFHEDAVRSAVQVAEKFGVIL
jgi:predicted NAD/FAD-binding protein